jgi:hypothetical protein
LGDSENVVEYVNVEVGELVVQIRIMTRWKRDNQELHSSRSAVVLSAFELNETCVEAVIPIAASRTVVMIGSSSDG